MAPAPHDPLTATFQPPAGLTSARRGPSFRPAPSSWLLQRRSVENGTPPKNGFIREERKKKVRTPPWQAHGRSNTAAHLDLRAAINWRLTGRCVNGVFTMTAARSRCAGSTSTCAASLRTAARMLQVRRLRLTCKPPRRAIPPRACTGKHARKHARTRQQGGSRSASQTTPSHWLLVCAVTS